MTAYFLGFALPGGGELLVIAIVFVLLFGGKRIWSFSKGIATAPLEFLRGKREADESMQSQVVDRTKCEKRS